MIAFYHKVGLNFPKDRNIFKTIDNKYLFGLSITFKSKIITKLTN